MARAYNIFVVHRCVAVGEEALVAAFTVKHELVSWLKKQPDPHNLTITRCPDGGRAPDKKIGLEELT